MTVFPTKGGRLRPERPPKPKRSRLTGKPASRPLPENPAVRCRRYVDGLSKVPWDLIRDTSVGPADKIIACALDSLSMGTTTVTCRNDVICAAASISVRQVHVALDRLETSGWILRARADNPSRRQIILLWKVADDFGGLIPDGATRPIPVPTPPTRPAQLPLFPDARGGG